MAAFLNESITCWLVLILQDNDKIVANPKTSLQAF